MSRDKVEQMIHDLQSVVDLRRSYFGIEGDSEDEIYFQGNDDGLYMFAASLLRSTLNKSEGYVTEIDETATQWFDDDIDIQSIKWTSRTRGQLQADKKANYSKYDNIKFVVFIILLSYVVIAACAFTYQQVLAFFA